MAWWPEKRSTPRYRMRLAVRYWRGELEGRAHTADLSGSGLLLEDMTEPVQVGQRLHLELKLPDGPFFAEAKVIRVDDAGTRAGLVWLSVFDVLPGARVTRGRS